VLATATTSSCDYFQGMLSKEVELRNFDAEKKNFVVQMGMLLKMGDLLKITFRKEVLQRKVKSLMKLNYTY